MNPVAAKNLAGLLLVLAVGAGIAGFILLHRSGPLFQSTATVRVVRDQTDLEQLPADAPAGLDNSVFLQNEAEIIRSDRVLLKVIERLELNQEWGKRYYDGQRLKTSETSRMLKAWVHVIPEPGSALLRIQAKSDNDPEATKLADALATAYCEYRGERRKRIAQDTIDVLAATYQENEAKVRQAGELVEKARRELDPAVREQNPPPQPAAENDENLRGLRTRYTRATMTHLTQSNQLARSTTLPPEDLQKLTAQVARAHTELTNAEAALKLEVKKQEALRTYWKAQQELEAANLVFAPVKTAVEEKRRDLGSLDNPPALVEEAASAAIALPAHNAAAGRGCLVGAGVPLLAGAGLLFQSRQPVAKVSS